MVWECEKCNKKWYYHVEKCIFCGSDLNSVNATKFTVRGVTEVFVPSVEHDSVPYFELLLEDENGNFHIKKSFANYNIGDSIESEASKEESSKIIGVIGTGIMGKGITHFFAQAGYSVILYGRETVVFLYQALKKIIYIKHISSP